MEHHTDKTMTTIFGIVVVFILMGVSILLSGCGQPVVREHPPLSNDDLIKSETKCKSAHLYSGEWTNYDGSVWYVQCHSSVYRIY